MRPNLSEFPKYPVPNVPQQPHVQPPTVFVYEKQRWEYRVVTHDVAEMQRTGEDELNALGKDGWELVGVLALPNGARFYFKRVLS